MDRRNGSAVFDFAGTGPEVFGNTNAPPAVTYSAIIYSLRCMVRQEIPLNQVPPSRGAWLYGCPGCRARKSVAALAGCVEDGRTLGAQGCMKPVTVRIPDGCLLSPSAEAAVVGGNVLTSQRVTDVVLKSFNAAAASQACCACGKSLHAMLCPRLHACRRRHHSTHAVLAGVHEQPHIWRRGHGLLRNHRRRCWCGRACSCLGLPGASICGG